MEIFFFSPFCKSGDIEGHFLMFLFIRCIGNLTRVDGIVLLSGTLGESRYMCSITPSIKGQVEVQYEQL